MSKKPKQKFSSIIKNNFYMLGIIARYIPAYFVLRMLHGVLYGVMDFASTYFSYRLLNEVNDGSSFQRAAIIIGAMALFNLAFYLFDIWFRELHDPAQKQKLHLRMHKELFEKSLTLDLACFDDPEFYNDFVWAMNESDTRAMEVMSSISMLTHNLIASVSILSLLFTIDPFVAVILLISSAVTLICNIIGNKLGFEFQKEFNPLERKKAYINRVYHLADYSKELRISRADKLLMNEYDENTKKIIDVDLKYGKKFFIFYGLGWNTLGQLAFFGVLIYMVFGLKNGAVDVGSFAATVGVVWRIRWKLISLAEILSKFVGHSLFIEKYREFLAFVPEIKDGETNLPKFESLEFKDVSFSYDFASHPRYKFHDKDYEPPKTDSGKYVLKNVNLKLKAGEKIAIVGYNGAGKTTLIKLMMRLYDATKGEILYNGKNIKTYEPTAYRRKIGTVFQDYKIFAATVAQNVKNDIYDENSDKEKVLSALKSADFTERLSTLENGIDTHLTREFNDEGINLSGGEAQKVAIARVFAKDFPIVIMDEPSSALDPMAEYNLNQSILNNTKDKTVIFISHRLSTTRIADKIYMFSGGELIEEGSHDELLAKDGKYAEMFRLQSEKYREDYK
jgi:ATP-binding cassette subfamily B protein